MMSKKPLENLPTYDKLDKEIDKALEEDTE